MLAKSSRLFSDDQRDAFVSVPPNLSDRDLGRFHTLSDRDLQIVNRHRRAANRLGVAVHLGLLRYPGRTLADVPEVPRRVIQYIAEQIGVDTKVFAHYGGRANTIFEHLDELRREFGFRNCGWPELHALGRELLPLALESDRSLPIIQFAVDRLRTQQIIAPGITTLERLVWTVQRLAQRRVECLLVQPLGPEQRASMDKLLQVDPELRTRTRLSWLREAPEIPSGKARARCAILELAVLPEKGDVRRIVRVPVLILEARIRVQVNNCVDAALGAQVDDSIEVTKTILLQLEGSRVVFEVVIVDGEARQFVLGRPRHLHRRDTRTGA